MVVLGGLGLNPLRTRATTGPTKRSAKKGVIATEAAIRRGSIAYSVM